MPAAQLPYGEAFEIAAYDDDAESRQFPSRLRFADGSEANLAEILARQPDGVLGSEFASLYGARFPLLPKTLNIKELLSVQAHPEGNTEVYIIIDAEPGATLRLGFRDDMDAKSFTEELLEGRRRQETILSLLGGELDPGQLQQIVSLWFAQRETGVEAIGDALAIGEGGHSEIMTLLAELKILYWRVLDSMNAVPVSAGQVIHNANPARITASSGRKPSAEVHALGNPEGKEILALEIRRPGPTFRAWDNVRFPIREIDVDAAVAALNLKGTSVDEYIVQPAPVAGRPGVFCSVDSSAFRVEHLRPDATQAVDVQEALPHCLHAIQGHVRLSRVDAGVLGELDRGESAFVPVGVGSYRLESASGDAEIIKVTLPRGV